MQIFSLRLRGVKLLEIGNIPGNAKLRDIRDILVREIGGTFEIYFFFCGKLLKPQLRVSEIFSGVEPAQDGRFYLFYEIIKKRIEPQISGHREHRQPSRNRYLSARNAIYSPP